jgi:NAD(P)-dependent dehydrogenase (short-subunit alcohol dehydrogenase family)
MNAMGISKDKVVEIESEIAKKYPLGRVGESQDIANGVLYLASDESSFVTGIDLVLDGGGQYI